MLTAVHTLIYADDPGAAREFFRNVLEWPGVDAGGGWLIFRSGPSELALHPSSAGSPQHHEIALVCDDIDTTIAELAAKGAEFVGGIGEERWGRTANIKIPGGGEMLIYQAKHPVAYSLPDKLSPDS